MKTTRSIKAKAATPRQPMRRRRVLTIPPEAGIGINEVSARLGVNRTHVYRVAIGERRSPRVEAALAALGAPVRRAGEAPKQTIPIDETNAKEAKQARTNKRPQRSTNGSVKART